MARRSRCRGPRRAARDLASPMRVQAAHQENPQPAHERARDLAAPGEGGAATGPCGVPVGAGVPVPVAGGPAAAGGLAAAFGNCTLCAVSLDAWAGAD